MWSIDRLRKTLRAVALLCTALTVSLSIAAEPIVIRDDRGDEHRFAASPQRIILMLPSLTEIVWVLGDGARLVGVDRFSNWSADIARLPHLGSLDDAQIEAIVVLKPDVVMASTTSRADERLEELGITVVRLQSESYADSRRTLDLIESLRAVPDAGGERVGAHRLRSMSPQAMFRHFPRTRVVHSKSAATPLPQEPRRSSARCLGDSA